LHFFQALYFRIDLWDNLYVAWRHIESVSMPEKLVNQYSPLSEPVFMILLSLAEGPRHGYGVMKDVAELSEGRVLLSTGTLYGALKRLRAIGWITRLDRRDEGDDGVYPGKDRKEYALTGAGRQVIQVETARLSALARTASERLVWEGGDG
jgi:DNA-binding PadR family transcriptional regulator